MSRSRTVVAGKSSHRVVFAEGIADSDALQARVEARTPPLIGSRAWPTRIGTTPIWN